jgi:hypothetical protein
MKIWFGTTTSQLNTYKEYYFAINNYLKELGCILPFDWLDTADKFYQTDYKDRNINKIYKQVTSAIDESDAVVIEYTVPNFSTSHQINYALLKRKPILVMRLMKDNPRFSDSYLEAITSPLLTLRQYTKKDFKEVIDEFLGIAEIGMGQQRYNILLEKRQKYYLDWAANEYKKSRSEILRDLVDDMSDQDEKYRKYSSYKKE